MAVRNTDTNPKLSSIKLREILSLETEIDAYLLKNTINGKASYLVSCTPEIAKILLSRYSKSGWEVETKYSGEYLQRFEFVDPTWIPVEAETI